MATKEMKAEAGAVAVTGNGPMIYRLIGEAMKRIGKIGKDSKNEQQGFMYRGIDAVYNALNPVMSDLGLFIAPEVLEQTREERRTIKKDYKGVERESVLMFSILKMKYTIFAPDGSNISCVVIGEGMDSGDKASNKAMSVAMKYAAFQLFMIPTEELVDPDAEVHTGIVPKDAPAGIVAGLQIMENERRTQTPAAPATVEKVAELPQPAQQATTIPGPVRTEAQVYLLKAMKQLREDRGITAQQNNKLFADQHKALIAAGLAPDKKADQYTLEEAEALIDAMYKNFPPTSAELNKNARKD